MARPKTFLEDAVLDQAIELFWHRGYADTSIQDLVDHLGINRGSLYDTFGGKKALYLAALTRYKIQRHEQMRLILRPGQPVREAIGAFLDKLVLDTMADGRHRGCLLTNTTAELAPHDPDMAAQVAENRQTVEQLLVDLLNEGQKRGEIAASADPVALAQFFFNTIQGIRILAKTDPSEEALRNVVKVALSVIK